MRQRRDATASSQVIMLLVLMFVLAAIASCSTMRPMAASDQDTPKLGDRMRFPQPITVVIANFPPEEIRTASRTFRAGDRCKIEADRVAKTAGLDDGKILAFIQYDRASSDSNVCPSGTVFWLSRPFAMILGAIWRGATIPIEVLGGMIQKDGLE